jgi:hypothetical protein
MSQCSEPTVLGLESYRVSLRLTRKQFKRALQKHLHQQRVTTLDDALVGALFEIVRESLVEVARGDRMRSGEGPKDWAARSRLIEKLSRQVGASLELLKEYCSPKRPLTTALAKPLLREFCRLEKILTRAEYMHRANLAMGESLKRARYPGDVSMAINDFLKLYATDLPAKDRHIVIAGCLVAADVYSKKDRSREVIERIPMQIIRSVRDSADAPRVVFHPRAKHKRKG